MQLIDVMLNEAIGKVAKYRGGMEEFVETLEDSETFYDEAHALGEMHMLEKIQKILWDEEAKSCASCVDYVDGICRDSKGHYCTRGSNMEDRYVPKEV